VQQQHQQWQQLLLPDVPLQQADGQGQAAGTRDSMHAPTENLRNLSAFAGSVHPNDIRTGSVRNCLTVICTLLQCVVVPHPELTPIEKQAAAAAGGIWPNARGFFPYRCDMQSGAHDVVVQSARDIVRLCEALLRDAAAMLQTAAQFHNTFAAAVLTPVQQLTATVLRGAEDRLIWCTDVVDALVYQRTTGELPHRTSALALAAISSGPGSKLQQQLFSLLCSMVKLGVAPIHADAPQSTADKSLNARRCLSRAAAVTAASLLELAGDKQQPCFRNTGVDSQPAVVSQLPILFILGRSCICWAQEFASAHPLTVQQQFKEPFVVEIVLPCVQQWLQDSSTQEQLVAAGYELERLLQQLQQLMAVVQTVRAFVNDPHMDRLGTWQVDSTARLQVAAQQLQAAGSALCFFAAPCLCNSPSCTNISGLTEMGTVSGRSCICGGCRVARYCGRACQRSIWKQHKPVCAALAAAATIHASTAAGTAVSVPLVDP
jgi:hypothetical protein